MESRAIQNKLLEWERIENPLAPLTSIQQETIFELSELFNYRPFPAELETKTQNSLVSPKTVETQVEDLSLSYLGLELENIRIETSKEFFDWYFGVEEEQIKENDVIYESYKNQLENHRNECGFLLNQIEAALKDLDVLNEQYQLVSTKTNSLHEVSEHLIAEQNQLLEISDEVEKRINFFNEIDRIISRLDSPTLSPSSEVFIQILDKLDECIGYMESHPKYKESSSYLAKYKHVLGRAVAFARSYIVNTFESATRQAQESAAEVGGSFNSDPSTKTFALLYGKFRASAPRVKDLLKQVEVRAEKRQEYAQLLMECHQCYVTQRELIVGENVAAGVSELASPQAMKGVTQGSDAIKSALWRNPNSSAGVRGDHCAIFRLACAFLIRVCEDEHQLFFQFFSNPSPLLTSYLDGLCTYLYDSLRPLVIHVNHLETLAELCSILRGEMLEDHVRASPDALQSFGKVTHQLLQDVQERLVFRTHRYLRSDILGFNPSPGDLAYPEKLQMMESIAMEQSSGLRRSESRSSVISMGSATSQEVAAIIHSSMGVERTQSSTSPADLHGMWYPTVRRALACLSRLHRCVDKATFRGLSHDVLSACIESVTLASQEITSKKGLLDGELFQIKHLLILREQTAPFQGDFSVTETSIDFSTMKNKAIGFVQRRISLSSSQSNSGNESTPQEGGKGTWWSLLGLLAEGATPKVKEQLLDSRKELDRRLKSSCEALFSHASQLLAQPLISILAKAPESKSSSMVKTPGEGSMEASSNNRPFTVEEAAEAIRQTQKMIKSKLPLILRSLRLYLANRETEFILFRPIKNNVVGDFLQLQQILNASFTVEERLLVGCPTAEQASVLLSSTMVTSGQDNKATNNH